MFSRKLLIENIEIEIVVIIRESFDVLYKIDPKKNRFL